MRGFDRRNTVAEALQWIDDHTQQLPQETVELPSAAARTLATDIHSQVAVPGFARAMMDGFAVRAADTQGASPYNPLTLRVAGEALPGKPCSQTVTPGLCARIMTGAPMPRGADAVLPVEQVVIISAREISAQGEVTPAKHVGQVGEDVGPGQLVLRAGRRLRPQDLGLLSSIGVGHLDVVQRARVRIVITGNELLPPGSQPDAHHITDANGLMLEALVRRDGGIAINPGIVPDDPEEILRAVREAVEVVLVSGGSSVGQEDHASVLLHQHGELPIHGIAMRPSSPTGIGRLGDRLVVLLPGNPVSCLCAYDFFAGRIIRRLGGRNQRWPYPTKRHRLARKIVSTVGRLDYVRVRLDEHGVEPIAVGGASVLSSTTVADGFVIVPEDSEGYPPGAEVDVHYYDI